jgi:hypothetical protein
MSNKRATNTKNWAAIRRKARQVDQQRKQQGLQRLMPPSASGNLMINCVAENNRAGGVFIGPGADVTSIGGTYRNNGGPDIDNHGEFSGFGDQIGTD